MYVEMTTTTTYKGPLIMEVYTSNYHDGDNYVIVKILGFGSLK
jgi:hypothetical protein